VAFLNIGFIDLLVCTALSAAPHFLASAEFWFVHEPPNLEIAERSWDFRPRDAVRSLANCGVLRRMRVAFPTN